MARKVNVKGVASVNAALKKRGAKTASDALAALYKVGLKIQRLAQTRVPVEYGNLRGSAYTRQSKQTKQMTVEVGFSADYALYVHENLEQKLKGQPRPSGLGVYWGPRGQPKFLESALNDIAKQIAPDVAREVKKGTT